MNYSQFNSFCMPKNYISSTIIALVLASFHFQLFAQFTADYQKKVDQQLLKLDLSGIKTGLLLNQSFFIKQEIEYYRQISNGDNIKTIDAHTWLSIYQRLRKAQIRSNEIKFPGIDTFVSANRDVNTKTNIVPIGVFNIEGTLLTEQQVLENEIKKGTGEKANSESYENIRFIGASVLQEDVFQSNIQFRVSPSLFFDNGLRSIKDLEINLGDGKGFRKLELRNQLIDHQFLTTGKHSIQIRLHTDLRSYTFESIINVKQLERKAPFKEFSIVSKPVVTDTTVYANTPGARVAAVPGANIRIVLGCDGVFNKPFIIAEGLDMGEDKSLDDLEALWAVGDNGPMQPYLKNGFDLVFVDYHSSRDYIQNNAQVLKNVIREINNTKVGTNDLIVMGVSMGGLIARYAIRQMETQSEAHHVSHMICFDSPHQGSNIPVGITQFYWETPADVMQNLVLLALSPSLYNKYTAFTSPASRQMMMHWGSAANVGVGQRHPEYDQLRTELNAMGNGGYPVSCRNIAMINGSMNASDRRIFDNFAYGDRILLGWVPGLRRNTMVDVHTNSINQDNQVMRVSVIQAPPFLPTFYTRTRNFNSPTNIDFLPGGRQELQNRLVGWLSTETFSWGYSPTYSTVDYQGPRNTQAERELLSVGSIQPSQTPFVAIYGNLQNLNSTHASPTTLPWGGVPGITGLGDVEGFFTGSGCPAITPPPAPNIYFSTSNCLPFSDYRERHGFDVTINVTATGPSYRQVLKIEKLGSNLSEEGYILNGQTSYTFQVYETGQYRVTCIRSYPGRPDVTSSATAVFNASDCNPPTFAPITNAPLLVNKDCAGFWENDYLVTFQDDTTKHVFAHITPVNNKLYASIGDGSITGNFVTPATLETYGFFSEFAVCFSPTDPRAPLPVTLQVFNVHAEGKTAQLAWRTTSEINSERFDIERSHTGRDWQKIGNVPTKDAGIENTDYTFTDMEPGSNLVYYRLKMVDTDGSYAFSKIETVKFSDAGIIVYPNPIEGGKQLQLLLNNSKVDKISIYDLSGKSVYFAEGPIEMINTKNLMNGRYVLKIRLKDGSESSHVIFKR